MSKLNLFYILFTCLGSFGCSNNPKTYIKPHQEIDLSGTYTFLQYTRPGNPKLRWNEDRIYKLTIDKNKGTLNFYENAHGFLNFTSEINLNQSNDSVFVYLDTNIFNAPLSPSEKKKKNELLFSLFISGDSLISSSSFFNATSLHSQNYPLAVFKKHPLAVEKQLPDVHVHPSLKRSEQIY